jgi:hypothetical protein
MLRTLGLPFALLLVLACGRSETPAPTTTTAPAPAPPPVAAPAPAAPAPFRVAEVDLGKQIAADKRVTAPAETFAPGDTIYAVVSTEGSAPKVTITARWTYEDGQLVNETSETIAPTGPAVTEFHIQKPGGLPAGKYKVAIASNGQPVGVRDFEVR